MDPNGFGRERRSDSLGAIWVWVLGRGEGRWERSGFAGCRTSCKVFFSVSSAFCWAFHRQGQSELDLEGKVAMGGI